MLFSCGCGSVFNGVYYAGLSCGCCVSLISLLGSFVRFIRIRFRICVEKPLEYKRYEDFAERLDSTVARGHVGEQVTRTVWV